MYTCEQYPQYVDNYVRDVDTDVDIDDVLMMMMMLMIMIKIVIMTMRVVKRVSIMHDRPLLPEPSKELGLVLLAM